MKRFISLTVITTLLVGFSPVYEVKAEDSYIIGTSYSFGENMENNQSMYKEYEELLHKSRSVKKVSSDNMVMSDELPEEVINQLNGDFIAFQYIEEDLNVELVDESQNGNVGSAIVHDNNNDLYFYIETNGNDDNALFYIEDSKFILEKDGDNLYLLSENDEKLMLVESIIIDDIGEKISESVQPRSSWILLAANLKKNNNYLLVVIQFLSKVGQVATVLARCDALSIVFTLTIEFAIDELGTFWKTIYIEYMQYYRSDCTTYIYEKGTCYENSNYTGYMDRYAIYYHTVKPDSLGQNCMAYS